MSIQEILLDRWLELYEKKYNRMPTLNELINAEKIAYSNIK